MNYKYYIFFHKTTMIYLDNNATTFMPQEVKDTIIRFMDQGNPSSDYKIARISKLIIDNTKVKIADVCSVSLDTHKIIFNSGASEGNNFILHSLAESYTKPHYILSSIEHKTSLECCKELYKRGLITYTLIKPQKDGTINMDDVINAINGNTKLISIMIANNETGAINDITILADIVKKRGILFHSDYVQLFGKSPPDMNLYGLDAITVSFHKLYGPPQCGFILVSNKALSKFNFCPMISGSQNDGWRGGTESAFLLAGALTAMDIVFKDRAIKNKKLYTIKQEFFNIMSRFCNIFYYADICHYKCYYKPGVNIIVFGPKDKSKVLPNTISISIVIVKDNIPNAMCNIKLKKELYDKDIIISLGSACNKGASSYVLTEMGVTDRQVSQGVIRISIGDYNSINDIRIFCKELLEIIDRLN